MEACVRFTRDDSLGPRVFLVLPERRWTSRHVWARDTGLVVLEGVHAPLPDADTRSQREVWQWAGGDHVGVRWMTYVKGSRRAQGAWHGGVPSWSGGFGAGPRLLKTGVRLTLQAAVDILEKERMLTSRVAE